MTATATRFRPLVMGVHTTVRGCGWVVFEGPFTPYDWGSVWTAKDKNAICLRKLKQLISRHQPETLVLEAFEPTASKRTARIARLSRAIVALAANRGLEVEIYTRSQVQLAFKAVGAVTRAEIAAAVAHHIEVFEHLLPARRKPWNCEDERMGLFAAAALALTHYRLDADDLIKQLAN